MKPRKSWLSACLVALAFAAVAGACGSDDDGSGAGPGPAGDGGSSSGNPGDGSPDADEPPMVDGPDVPPIALPGAPPALFGYALEDAFPGTFLSGAMDMAWPAGSKQPFVLQRGGHIVRLHGDGTRDLVLDFESQVAMRDEAGTLGFALHPKFADAADPHPYVYVWFNAEGAPTHQKLVRFTYNTGTGNFDLGSQLTLVDQTEAATEHNGARVRFGPDGFLYFGNGDDTRSAETAQRLDGGLFSGIFRIDVDMQAGKSHPPPRQPLNGVTQGYWIPNDNPFVGTANANEEYFALGFRNPYAFSFDREGGTIWLGDVGETFREEVNKVEKGGNYGWPFMEGTRQVKPGTPTIGTPKAPTFEYSHASLGDLVATMEGFVYRGKALPELNGKLVFSDWPTGRIWALDTTAKVRTSLVEHNADNAPVGFGQDADGEIYVIAWSKILKIVRAAPHTVPKKLSETKVFRNTQTMLAPSALTPYSIQSPLWSDGAGKQRWVYVPAGAKATMKDDGTVQLPPGSLLVKHFELPMAPAARSARLETRVLVIGAEATYGLTYKWDAKGRDADLVMEAIDESYPDQQRQWHYPSTGECWSCHRAENRILGFRGEQLNANDQLAALVKANVLDEATIAMAPQPIPTPSDESAPLEGRAMAVLAANCSPCHHPGASYLGSGDTWNARPGVAPADRGIINAPHHNPPMANALGLPNAPLVAPGNSKGSLLLARMRTVDPDLRMPPLLRTRIDDVGTKVVESWIDSLPSQ